MDNTFAISTKSELTGDGKAKLSRIITYESGKRVEIPLNRDGSVKWFDDNRLKKVQETA